MPTPKECRQNAGECLRLARESTQIYAKEALLELAAEFLEVAEKLQRRRRRGKERARHAAREDGLSRARSRAG